MRKRKLSLLVVVLFAAGIALSWRMLPEELRVRLGGPIYTNHIDSTVNIQDDFYHFAVGRWMKENPIPPTESAWGSFNEVRERNKVILKEILTELLDSKNAYGSNRQKIADFYRTGMDSVAAKRLGLTPAHLHLREIDRLQSPEGLVSYLADKQAQGWGILFYLYAGQDDKNSEQVVPNFWQAGLSLPDRSYYLEPKFQAVRDAYEQHISSMLQQYGTELAMADERAHLILKMETMLAERSMDRVAMRDPHAVYNKIDVKRLSTLAPAIDWEMYLRKCHVPAETKEVIVGQPEFLAAVSKMLQEESLENWKIYLSWKLMNRMAPYLTEEVGQMHFDFYSKKLRGVKQRKVRWERVLNELEGGMGEMLGQLYVERAFKPEAKARMLKMVESLRAVFRERIQKSDWMSAETQKKAIVKLEKFIVKIGYPDKWRDYSSLDIQADSYVENIMRVQAFEYKRNMNKIGKPVDKTEWGMSPQTVNAYYNPSMNEIVFPAGILQPPFFDFEADDATIYGAIGAVIGHEMTHGFDDQGRQYDADGNLKDWWSKEDEEKFNMLAEQIVAQFDAYKVLDTVSVNGKLTLGENIADLGGLAIAYDAFSRTAQAKSNQKINGLTPDQRFFMAWANAWKGNMTHQSLLEMVTTDPHAPKEWRCNGPITHMQQFYDAFGIKEGGKMFRPKEQRILIW